mmetsp:Transcript_5437/g.6949  ORF Transcript_5437/g.6949 Transcript_5437/m.6949 type:complete len:87 (-) Transcript_5437:286-546(-)
MNSNENPDLTKSLSIDTSEALTNCLLSQYRFCAGGVGLGAAYGIKYSKGPLPMVTAGVMGTFGDLVYGYVKACKKEVEDYDNGKSK